MPLDHQANRTTLFVLAPLLQHNLFSALGKSVTRERAIATEAKAARKAADRAEGEKTRFIASASHDLRQPVSSLVLNFSSHLAKHPEFVNDPAVADMRSSIESLSSMLESILTVSKLDANVLVPRVTTVNLYTIFERCLAANAISARQKNIQLRVRGPNLSFQTDPEMLFRALNNIVNNAIKYTHSGGVLFGVRKRYGGHALFVMDSGIGIPSESINSIYDEFTMLVDSSRKSGSGLGLSIVRKVLDRLGMRIHTLSKPGVGSTFYIQLPNTTGICREQNSQPNRPVPEQVFSSPVNAAPPISSDGLSSRLVAVIDDNEMVRKSICRVLEAHGMRTMDAAGMSDLLALLDERHPDFLITDYKLEHGHTGYDVILKVRQIVAPDLPCFIVTGDTDPSLVQEMAQRGVEVCYKPMSGQLLVETIHRQLKTTAVQTIAAG